MTTCARKRRRMRIAAKIDNGKSIKVRRRVAKLTRLSAPTLTRYNGKPALGTRRVSRPRAVPTNAAACPCSRSSSAMARAGITWPPVPPPARTIFISIRLLRDVEQHAHAGQGDDERRAAVGDERQRNPLGGEQSQHDADVEKGLDADHGGDADGQNPGEIVTRPPRRAQSAEAEKRKGRNEAHRSDQSQLLGDHGEDEVGLRLGQIEEL